MNQNKKIAIGMVSGLFVLGGISSAFDSHHAKATPVPTTTTFYHAVQSDVDKIKSNVNHGITTTTNKVHAAAVVVPGNKIAKAKSKVVYCASYDLNTNWQTCTFTAEQKREHLKRPPKDTPSNDCSDNAAALAAVALLSGNIQTAAAAGKIAADTAGTGQKC